MGKIKFAYCKYCQKEVEPAKKPLNSHQKTILVMFFIGTLGFGIIVWLIYSKVSRKKNFCPKCSSKLTFSKEPFEKPKELAETLTAKQKVLKKVEKKKAEKPPAKKKPKEVKKDIFCPFCGIKLEDTLDALGSCPACKGKFEALK